MSRRSAIVLLIAVTAVWGATFTVIKFALAESGPFTFLALRFLLAAALVAPSLSRGVRAASSAARVPPLAIGCGIALFAGLALQTVGLGTTTPARSAFITALSAVLVPLVGPVLGIERFSLRAWAGALLACAGLAVILHPGRDPLSAGDILTLGGAVVFAIHIPLLNAAVRQASPAFVNAIQVAVVAAAGVGAGTLEGWQAHPSMRLAIVVVATATLATVAAFRVMAEVQRVLSGAETGVVLAFEPFVAAVVSVATGADVMTASLFVGGSAVVAGVLLATWRPRQTGPPAARG